MTGRGTSASGSCIVGAHQVVPPLFRDSEGTHFLSLPREGCRSAAALLPRSPRLTGGQDALFSRRRTPAPCNESPRAFLLWSDCHVHPPPIGQCRSRGQAHRQPRKRCGSGEETDTGQKPASPTAGLPVYRIKWGASSCAPKGCWLVPNRGTFLGCGSAHRWRRVREAVDPCFPLSPFPCL